MSLLENWRQSRQNLLDDTIRQFLYKFASTRRQIQGTRLIAPDDSCSACARPRQGDRETGHPSETSTSCDGNNDGHLRHSIEYGWRNDQNWAASFLLVTFGRIEPDQPDFTPVHLRSVRDPRTSR